MLKKILSFLLIFFLSAKSAGAFKAETFVSFSNPVRGYEGWSNEKQTPLDLPKFIYQESTHSALPVTWLLRYDALESATISGYFKKLIESDKNQSLGAFLEITPKLVESIGVNYPPGFSIFNANRIFLSGYEDKTRVKIIDKYMDNFFGLFGFYPQSISACQLDSYSLQYLQEKYSVLAAVNCEEQYNPYFPDKNNSFVPAKRLKERVSLAMVSKFSLKLNDKNYFAKILSFYSQKEFNEFTHINLGLENDYSLQAYQQEIKNVIKELSTSKEKYNLRPISLSSFGDWFKARYPESSPTYFYKSTDPLSRSGEEVSWYQSPWYRFGMRSEAGKTKILDLRAYNRDVYEDHYLTPNQNTSLYHELPSIIDTAKNADQNYYLDFDISKSKLIYNKHLDNWKATLVEGNKQLIMEPDQVTFVGFDPPAIAFQDIQVVTSKGNIIWKINPTTPYKSTINFFWVMVIAYLLYKFFKSPKPPVFGLFLSLVAGITLYRSGTLNSFGMGFWGPNGHDAIFHLSLINHFSTNPFSLSNPQFAGVVLQDYHFVFDYFLGILSRFTYTDSRTLYFVIFPVISSIFLVKLLSDLLNKWGFSSIQKNLSFIFVFLGGSLGFIPRLISDGNLLSGESAFWANQSVSVFLNPPFVLSLIIIHLFLNKLHDLRSTNIPADRQVHDLITLSLLGGLLAQTKIYAFILLIGALLLNKKYKIFLGVLVVGALITLPFASFSGSPFVFQPLWFTKSLFASLDRVYWSKLVQAWQTYELVGPFYKLFIVNLFAVAVFLLGNLGFRIIGFFDRTQPLVKTITVLGILIPLLFTQKINPWNTIQFMYYSIFFLGIFAGKVLANFKRLIIPVIIFATITSVGTLRDYLTYKSSSRISYSELQALDALKNSPRGVVLSPAFTDNSINPPKPQYSYVTSSYISALTGHPEFLSDTINLDITGIRYQERFNEIQKFYNTTDKEWATKYLIDNNIKYVYETPLKKLNINPADLKLSPLYDSGEIKIYRYN